MEWAAGAEKKYAADDGAPKTAAPAAAPSGTFPPGLQLKMLPGNPTPQKPPAGSSPTAKTHLIHMKSAVRSTFSVRNLAALKPDAHGETRSDKRRLHPHVDCGLEYRTWHGDKDFSYRVVTPEAAGTFLSELTTEMEDRIHTLTTPVDEDARARWLHMPGVNLGLLDLLKQHLCLAPEAVEHSRSVVANGEIEVSWFTEEQLSGEARRYRDTQASSRPTRVRSEAAGQGSCAARSGCSATSNSAQCV
jgi:hypothetical protein